MLVGSAQAAPTASPAPAMFKQLIGNIPVGVKGAKALGTRLDPQTRIDVALTLPLRNKAALDDLDAHLFDPADPLYHKYPTDQEMIDRFSPAQADYDAVAAFARSQGLTVTQTFKNRMLVDVSGPAAAVETAFGVRLMQFQDKDGRVFHAPDQEPSVPAALAPRLLGVLGMDDDAVAIPQMALGKIPSSKLRQARKMTPLLQQPVGPGDGGGGTGGGTTPPPLTITGTAISGTGTVLTSHFSGPYGYISPSDIKTAYNLNSVPSTGQGQILDMVELNGFNPSDITAYEDAFGLPHVPIQIISVDGVSNVISTVDTTYLHSSPAEATLDLEMAVGIAPGLSLIRVYEGPLSSKGLLDILNTTSSAAGRAYQTSCSWAFTENGLSTTQKQSEGNALQYMISLGNCFFASSGDWGPYDDSTHDNVTALDPASQGWACAVGGTKLFTDQYGNYSSETTWNEPYGGKYFAGGGSISNYWLIRNQKPVISAASGGSTTMRNVPDVSLNSAIDFALYFNGGWYPGGGTSAATPIWASFLALVNSRLNGQSIPPLADFTSTLYSIAQGPGYGADFHDIADGSNNRKYQGGPGNQAVPGYDLTTGLGSFNGANLFSDLVARAGGR